MLNQFKKKTQKSSLPCNLVSGVRKVNVSRNKDGPHLLLFCPLQLQPPDWQLASQPLNVCAPPGPRAKWGGRQPGPYRPGLRPPSSSWVPAPTPPPQPPAIHSVPPIIPPRASFLVLGVPTPTSHSVPSPPHSPPQIVPHRGCRPHPNGCSLLSMSLEQFSQWKDVLSHSRCQLRGQQNSGSWTHGAHFLLTSDEDAWSQWR